MLDLGKLVSKPITELTSKEMAELQSGLSVLSQNLSTRQKEMKEETTGKAFEVIAQVAQKQMTGLGYQKLPSLTLVGQENGTYKVSYAAIKVKKVEDKSGGRQTLGLHAGKITVSKLNEMLGEIKKFRLKDGREFENLRDTVVGLGYSLEDKSQSLSSRLVHSHPEVTLVLANREITVGEAVRQMEEARIKVAEA